MTTRQSSKRKRETLTPWTDEELTALATVTPEDIAQASALWRQNAGKLANLLDAKEADETLAKLPHA